VTSADGTMRKGKKNRTQGGPNRNKRTIELMLRYNLSLWSQRPLMI